MKSANDDRPAPIPLPRGGFKSNEDEAQWLEQTIVMRMNEVLRAAGVNRTVAPKKLYELFLMSLNDAGKRALKGRPHAS